MAASTVLPDVTVEIAFADGYSTPAASRTWTDVSSYVEFQDGVKIDRGRQDELGDVTPSRLTLTLDNKDGRFTPEYAAGAYYPNVKKGRPIRVSAVWPLGGGGTTYRRFTGYVDEWPVSWPDPGGAMSTVTITASSRMARLGRTAPLRSLTEIAYLADEPSLYYTLGDPDKSTVAAESSGGPVLRSRGTGSPVVFGNATGPRFDSLTAAEFSGGKYLKTDDLTSFWDDLGVGSTDLLMEAFINTTVTAAQVAVAADMGLGGYLHLGTDSSGRASASYEFGMTSVALNSSTVVADGETHHLAVRQSEATNSTYLYLDGVEVDSDTTPAVHIPSSIIVGHSAPDGPSASFTGTVAHAAFKIGTAVPDANIAFHADSGLTGFSGDSTDEWIERLADYAGIPSAEVSTEAGNTTSVTSVDTSDTAAVEAMLDIARTENGVLFDAGDGTLTFHSRGHRYGAASTLTLSATTQQIEQGLEPKLDDQGLINKVVVNSLTTSAQVFDQASIDDHGVYEQTYTLLTTSDSEVEDFANYVVSKYGEPGVRVPDCSVQLVTQASATVTALLAREIGDLITLSGLPTQAPASSMTFFIEGINETLGFESWLISFNLSPGDIPGDVWILGTSQLGTTTVLAY